MALALIPSAYESLLRPLLFKLPPERAQRLADQTLKAWPLWRGISAVNLVDAPEVATSAGGLDMVNPVGLAAGYDKVCQLTPGLSSLGFGYVTCGTVTRDARSGNPGVRLLRDPRNLALINSLGFPGDGLEAALENLSKNRHRVRGTPIVVSISGTEIDDIVTCHRSLEPVVDAGRGQHQLSQYVWTQGLSCTRGAVRAACGSKRATVQTSVRQDATLP